MPVLVPSSLLLFVCGATGEAEGFSNNSRNRITLFVSDILNDLRPPDPSIGGVGDEEEEELAAALESHDASPPLQGAVFDVSSSELLRLDGVLLLGAGDLLLPLRLLDEGRSLDCCLLAPPNTRMISATENLSLPLAMGLVIYKYTCKHKTNKIYRCVNSEVFYHNIISSCEP